MSNPPYRRTWGLFLGLATAMAFALVSQLINIIVMPGVPLFLPPFGAVGNVLISVLLGTVIGLLAAWPDNFFIGVVLSSLVAWLAVSVASIFTGQVDSQTLMNRIAALILILVPIVGFFVPFMAFFRWIVMREENSKIEQERLGTPWKATRLILPALLLIAAGWLGYFNLYPPRGQNAATRMHQIIQQGQQAASDNAIPGPLLPPNVNGFREKGAGKYTMRWDPDESNRYNIPRPSGNDPASAVITNFENGWLLVCIFTSPDRPPNCRGFDSPPRFAE